MLDRYKIRDWIYLLLRGRETIAEHRQISNYTSQSGERGSNENLNGLVRQYFPKGSNLSLITTEMVIEVVNALNNRPRKRYSFKSPNEVYLLKLNIN